MTGGATRRGQTGFVVGFLAPAVLIYGLFVVWPLIQAFAMSLYNWQGISMDRQFIGFKNFIDLKADSDFHHALINNLLLLFVGGGVSLGLALLIAHALQDSGKLSKTMRSFVLFPQMLSLVVVALLWKFIFNPRSGLVTSAMNALHLGPYAKTWLADAHTALTAVGLSVGWWACGFYVMLFTAGIRAIPQEVGEAAELDGARGILRFRQITWPMLWSIKRIAIVHVTITVMNVFVLVYLMTRDGQTSTDMMLTLLYRNAFKFSKYGYATSVAVANFVVVMILSALILFAFRKNPETSR